VGTINILKLMELEKEIHIISCLLYVVSLMTKCRKIFSLLSKVTFVVSRVNSKLSEQCREFRRINLDPLQGLTVVLIDEIA
jgi:hypothetical protein